MNTTTKTGPSKAGYDVVIVGARCAGAATAMLLAKNGVSVLAVDRKACGSDTLSAHALMRPAVSQLRRWGLLEPLVQAGTPVMTSTVFHYGETRSEVSPEPGLPGLIAPRRALLDRLLCDAAQQEGAEIVHDTAAIDLVRAADGRVTGVVVRCEDGRLITIRAGLVIGADGINSLVARIGQAATIARGRAAATHIYGYVRSEDDSASHWHFGERAGAFVVPTNRGQTCLGVSVSTRRFDTELRGRLAHARLTVLDEVDPELAMWAWQSSIGEVQAYRGAPGFLREASGPGWAVVGDAGFYHDPVGSHGISDAFRDAESLAHAILAGGQVAMARYGEERDQLAKPILEVTDAMAGFDLPLPELEKRHKQLALVMKTEMALLERRRQRRPRMAA